MRSRASLLPESPGGRQLCGVCILFFEAEEVLFSHHGVSSLPVRVIRNSNDLINEGQHMSGARASVQRPMGSYNKGWSRYMSSPTPRSSRTFASLYYGVNG